MISSFPKLTALERLDLRGNKIVGKTPELFHNLPQSLTRLDIGGCDLSEECRAALDRYKQKNEKVEVSG